MKPATVFLAGLLSVSAGMAAISGRVTNTSQAGIPGATVRLEKDAPTVTTDNNGNFTLPTSQAGIVASNPRSPRAPVTIQGGLLKVHAAAEELLEIAAFGVGGRILWALRRNVEAGDHSFPLDRSGPGVCLYRMTIGSKSYVLPVYSTGNFSCRISRAEKGRVSANGVGKRSSAWATMDDVIAVTKGGYLNYRQRWTNPDTSGVVITMIVCADSVRDIDGNVYQAVRIGNQVWTAENIRVTKYTDGTPIAKLTDRTAWFAATSGAYCYYDNSTDPAFIKRYGALYNFYAISNAKFAPAGWHVPVHAEFDALNKYLPGGGFNWDGSKTGIKYTKSLAAKVDWAWSDSAGHVGNDLSTNNRTGFAALPSGYRYADFDFNRLGHCAIWWTNRRYSLGYELALYMVLDDYEFGNSSIMFTSGFAVRLVRD